MVAIHTEAEAGLGTLENSCFLLVLYCAADRMAERDVVLEERWARGLRRKSEDMWQEQKGRRERWSARGRDSRPVWRGTHLSPPWRKECYRGSLGLCCGWETYSGYKLQVLKSQTEWRHQAVSGLYLSGLSQNIYYLILFNKKTWEPKEWVPCL